jgi:hypothetical protein
LTGGRLSPIDAGFRNYDDGSLGAQSVRLVKVANRPRADVSLLAFSHLIADAAGDDVSRFPLAAQLAHALAAVDQPDDVALQIVLDAQEVVRVGEMANSLQRMHITDGPLNCAVRPFPFGAMPFRVTGTRVVRCYC